MPGAEKGPPGEFRRPVTRSFFQTEQDPADGSPKGRGDSRRSTTGYKITFFSVVSKVTKFAKGRVDPPESSFSLRDPGRNHSTTVDHGPFLPDGQATGY